jgi:hypothetical protein
MTRNCKQCGNSFTPLTKRSIYCSGECVRKKEAAYSKRRRTEYSSERKKAILAAQKMRSQPCEVCGLVDADAHHDDYAKPTDVRWLCRSHHRQHHAKFGPGLNA